MQSECAILFVGETWMRPLRVHPFEGSVHEVFSVITPFVQFAADEGRSSGAASTSLWPYGGLGLEAAIVVVLDTNQTQIHARPVCKGEFLGE